MINRRSLITGLISFIAAPAIVRASNLMPVKTMLPTIFFDEEACRKAMDVLIQYNYSKIEVLGVAYGKAFICNGEFKIKIIEDCELFK